MKTKTGEPSPEGDSPEWRDMPDLLGLAGLRLPGSYLLLSVVPLYAAAAGAGGLAAGATMLSTVLLALAVPRLAGRLGYRAVMDLGLILLGAPVAALATSPALPRC